jgi:hypothetical protein
MFLVLHLPPPAIQPQATSIQRNGNATEISFTPEEQGKAETVLARRAERKTRLSTKFPTLQSLCEELRATTRAIAEGRFNNAENVTINNETILRFEAVKYMGILQELIGEHPDRPSTNPGLKTLLKQAEKGPLQIEREMRIRNFLRQVFGFLKRA